MNYEKKAAVFLILAAVLTNVMCAVVAFQYCNMLWQVKLMETSAPADTAFLLVIPFAISIGFCIGLAVLFYKKDSSR